MTMYGLWSLARKDWMLDPMSDDDPPPPLKFESVMDAIKEAANRHSSFQIVPLAFGADGRPRPEDLVNLWR